MYQDKKILALIPARGGSKGVPRKNVKLLAGLPLVAHSIMAGKSSRYIDRVIVSTDNQEIADVARKCGGEVPFMRPAELAEDLTPDYPVFEHALAWLDQSEGYRPDIIVHLRPTGALRRASDIDAAIEYLEQYPEADSLRSVHEPDKTPYKMWRIDQLPYMVPFLSGTGIAEHYNAPRQLLPKVYATNANIGLVRAKTLSEQRSIIGTYVLAFIVTEPVVDFDTEFDFEVGELILRRRTQPANE